MPATKLSHDPPNEPRKTRRMLLESFRCDRRRLDLQMHECMTSYVNANALQTKASPCFNCPVGQENRTDFAKAE